MSVLKVFCPCLSPVHQRNGLFGQRYLCQIQHGKTALAKGQTESPGHFKAALATKANELS